MADYFGTCAECQHFWPARKPPDEIDQPRCSECDATGTSIRFVTDAEAAEAVQQTVGEPELVRTAKRVRRWYAVRQRLTELVDRLEYTAPPDADQIVAREVREPFWEANKLLKELKARGTEIGLDVLKGVSDSLDELEAEIEPAAPELEKLDDLDTAIGDRRRERTRLRSRVENLKGDEYQLAQRIRKLREDDKFYRELLEDIEDEQELFELGEDSGRYEAKRKLGVQCARCGNPIPLEPGSQMHHVAIQALRTRRWFHGYCQSGAATAAE